MALMTEESGFLDATNLPVIYLSLKQDLLLK